MTRRAPFDSLATLACHVVPASAVAASSRVGHHHTQLPRPEPAHPETSAAHCKEYVLGCRTESRVSAARCRRAQSPGSRARRLLARRTRSRRSGRRGTRTPTWTIAASLSMKCASRMRRRAARARRGSAALYTHAAVARCARCALSDAPPPPRPALYYLQPQDVSAGTRPSARARAQRLLAAIGPLRAAQRAGDARCAAASWLRASVNTCTARLFAAQAERDQGVAAEAAGLCSPLGGGALPQRSHQGAWRGAAGRLSFAVGGALRARWARLGAPGAHQERPLKKSALTAKHWRRRSTAR